jgi:hypothetical protein
MAKQPDLRYPDGRTMAEDLEDVAKGLRPRHRRGWPSPAPKTEAQPAPPPPPPREPAPETPKTEPVAETPARAQPSAPPRDRRGLVIFFLGLLVVAVVGYLLLVRG